MKVAISWQSHQLLVTLRVSSLVWGGLRIAGQEALVPATSLGVEGLCLGPCGPSPIMGCPQEAAWLNALPKGNGP